MFLYIAISKKKQNNSVKDIKEYCNKIICAIAIFIAQFIIDKVIATKYNFVAINKEDKFANKLIIFVLKIWKKTIYISIYEGV